MKAFKISVVSTLLASLTLFAVACGGEDKGAIKSVAVNTDNVKTEYLDSDGAENFSANGLVVTVAYENGDKETLPASGYAVDHSAVVWGEVGSYAVKVTPNGQNKSANYTVSLAHAWGTPNEGKELCAGCGAEREKIALSDRVVCNGWNEAQSVTATEGTPYGVVPSGEKFVTYRTVEKGECTTLKLKMVELDATANWNLPLIGIRSGNVGILPREDNWVLTEGPTKVGEETPSFACGLSSGNPIVGEAKADSQEWQVYSDGGMWFTSDLKLDDEITVSLCYRADGIMEITHLLNGGSKKIFYTLKVPDGAYEVIAYGEKCTFEIKEVVFVKEATE